MAARFKMETDLTESEIGAAMDSLRERLVDIL
jgi:hypothetical protein